jgi:hypothetical protein
LEKQQQAREQAREAEKQVPEWTKDVEVGYKNGAYIKTTDDRWSLKMNVGIEPLWLYDDTPHGEPNDSTFRIRRARWYMSGNGFYPWLKYYTQLSLEGGSASLLDAYVEATKLDYLQPRAGQFKVPFDREFLDSGFALPFIERSTSDLAFKYKRFNLEAGYYGNTRDPSARKTVEHARHLHPNSFRPFPLHLVRLRTTRAAQLPAVLSML